MEFAQRHEVFMDSTLGHAVIMEEKILAPEKYRPLKNRTNIIISRNNFTANNCIIVHSIQESLKCMIFKKVKKCLLLEVERFIEDF